MGEIRNIEGQGPFHLSDNPKKEVEKAGPPKKTRSSADEYSPYDDGSGIQRKIVAKSLLGDTVELHTEEPEEESPKE